MSHARLALRNALGLASIKLAARCLALLHAIGFRAMSDARSSYHAVISARVSAAKTVPLTTARNAA
jgi:hypothetical protein